MKLHKEGKNTILVAFLFLAVLTFALMQLGPKILWYQVSVSSVIFIFLLIIIRFFRVPNREFIFEDDAIMAPADGKIVVIEEVFEDEYIKEKCLQISVFMSPYDVHINWFPFQSKIRYYKYHPGKHMAAWHPKSSKLNERTSVCIETSDGKLVMVRQIAGAMARRIVCYAEAGQTVKQNQELGFIKFGSRVDLFLPLSVKNQVQINQKVVGGQTIIARF